MEEILQQVSGAQMMSLLDGFSSYNQIASNLLIVTKPPSLPIGEHMHITIFLLV
jgi:hypothetical protein